VNLLIFQRLISVLSLRALATSSRGLKKDYPWSDDLEKLPDPFTIYELETLHVSSILPSHIIQGLGNLAQGTQLNGLHQLFKNVFP
jgi:hypothetical protein